MCQKSVERIGVTAGSPQLHDSRVRLECSRMTTSICIASLAILLFSALAHADPPDQRLRTTDQVAKSETERAVAAYKPSKSLADSLRTIPFVTRIKAIEPKQPVKTVIHLRDWHFLTRDVFDADVRAAHDDPVTDAELNELYESFLVEVERVQAEQIAILRCLVCHHELRRAYSEGLTKRDMLIFNSKVSVMRKLEADLPGYQNDLAEAKRRMRRLEESGQTNSDDYRTDKELAEEIESLFHQHRLELLRIGAAGRMLLAGELAEVVPIEDEVSFENANPIGKDGSVTLDAKKNRRREDAQVKKLLKGEPLVVVILGGSHDLSDNIARLANEKCRYVVVTTRAFAEAAGERPE